MKRHTINMTLPTSIIGASPDKSPTKQVGGGGGAGLSDVTPSTTRNLTPLRRNNSNNRTYLEEKTPPINDNKSSFSYVDHSGAAARRDAGLDSARSTTPVMKRAR